MKSIMMLGHTFVIVSVIMKGITSDSQVEELLGKCTRYGIHNFYKEITLESPVLVCSYNHNIAEPGAFSPIVQGLKFKCKKTDSWDYWWFNVSAPYNCFDFLVSISQEGEAGGKRGYTAPEYAIHGHLTEKVDIYSFGIVVLEIISGLHCTNLKIESVNDSLLEYAWQLHEDDRHLDLVDEKLDPSDYDTEYVKRVINLALMCTQLPASRRPAMSEVVVLLTS
uniref:Serine-threonine/tyrosine-protein kinase catalytic domain-containing protein n=1 Tax=Daucus carota subsp. sativus TaxID=79200 RepID=A0A175YKV4_DAUCS